MIGYITLGTNNFDKAAEFYDELLAEIGGKRAMEMDTFIAWSNGPQSPMLCIIKPFNKEPATIGNGSMVGLQMENEEMVQKLYKKAIELGGTDEGEPGPRGSEGNFYAAYFRDLDGNKLCAFYFPGE